MTESEVMRTVINLLNSAPSFMDRLSTFTTGEGEFPMLVQGMVLPKGWSVDSTSCMLYFLYNNAQLEYTRIHLSASCRAPSYIESRELATALQDALNRRCMSGFFIVTDIAQTIPPDDGEMDNFNTPVEIFVRAS